MLTATNPPCNDGADYVAQYIESVSPHIKSSDACSIAKTIVKATSRTTLDPYLVAAILRQESNFQHNLKVCVYNERVHRTVCDYGIAQINELWIRPLRLNTSRLQHSDAYNVGVMVSILQSLSEQHRDQKFWYGYYHDSRPKYMNEWLRLVNHFYLKSSVFHLLQLRCV